MRSFRAVRLAELAASGRPGLAHRTVTAGCHAPAGPLRVGARTLALFGLGDDWRPARHDSDVYLIEDAFVLSSAGIVGLATGEVAEDTLDHTDPALDGYERRGGTASSGLDGLVRFKGGVLDAAATPTAIAGRHLHLLLGVHTNHFHWLLMNFARLSLLSGADLQVDSVLVPDGLGAVHLEAMRWVEALRGIPLQLVRRGQCLRVGSLVLPWNVASGYGVNPAAVRFLRGLLPVQRSAGKRRIYVDRRQSRARCLVNEDELIDALRKVDVEAVRLEGLSLGEQADLFCGARLVVASGVVWSRTRFNHGAQGAHKAHGGSRRTCFAAQAWLLRRALSGRERDLITERRERTEEAGGPVLRRKPGCCVALRRSGRYRAVCSRRFG